MRHCDAVVKELLARADEPGSTPIIFGATTFFHLVNLKQLPMVLTHENIVENHLNIALLSVF